VTLASYQSALVVSGHLITNLSSILYGNGEGTFKERPTCASWFLPGKPKVAPKDAAERIRGAGVSPAAAAPKKQKTATATDVERLKALGVLSYDALAKGANLDWIDLCPVKALERPSKVREQLCMKILTLGFACGGTCKKPHFPNLNVLLEGDHKKLVDFVSKSSGLSWVPGKEPAGTT